MDLFEQISNDIKEAMKAKDKVRLETLRNVKKCFLEAKTAPGANDTLTDEAALKIMQKLVKQGKDSAAVYEDKAVQISQKKKWLRYVSSKHTFPNNFQLKNWKLN